MLNKVAKILKEFVRENPLIFSVMFAALIIEGFLTGLAVLAVAPLADYLIDPELANPSAITVVCLEWLSSNDIEPSYVVFGAIFVGINVIKAVFDLIIRFTILVIKYAILRQVIVKALGHLLRARWRFFADEKRGLLLNSFNREANVIGDGLGHITSQLANIVQLVIYILLPLYLSPLLVVCALSLATLLAAPFLLLNKLSYRLGTRNTETANEMLGTLGETLAAMRLIIGFGRQQEAQQRYINALDGHVDATIRSQMLSSGISYIFQPIAIFAAVTATGVAISQGTSFSAVAAIMWSLVRAMPLVSRLLENNLLISNFLPSYEQVKELTNGARDDREREHGERFTGLQDDIIFDDVCFSHGGRGQVVSKVNLIFKKGQKIAICGESGAGKSTIIDLLLGLQSPESGSIKVGTQSLAEVDLLSYRSFVGFVPQEPQLFDDTIAKNLRWANPKASTDELWEACELACAGDFVRALPGQLETEVGDRGVRLSGGQRQRLTLARALLRKPDLLILDEATSSLDQESEWYVQQSLEALNNNITVVMVAHRLSTIQTADFIYVMDKGRVAESGTFDALNSRTDSRFVALMNNENVS